MKELRANTKPKTELVLAKKFTLEWDRTFYGSPFRKSESDEECCKIVQKVLLLDDDLLLEVSKNRKALLKKVANSEDYGPKLQSFLDKVKTLSKNEPLITPNTNKAEVKIYKLLLFFNFYKSRRIFSKDGIFLTPCLFVCSYKYIYLYILKLNL